MCHFWQEHPPRHCCVNVCLGSVYVPWCVSLTRDFYWHQIIRTSVSLSLGFSRVFRRSSSIHCCAKLGNNDRGNPQWMKSRYILYMGFRGTCRCKLPEQYLPRVFRSEYWLQRIRMLMRMRLRLLLYILLGVLRPGNIPHTRHHHYDKIHQYKPRWT